jgi:hypothetical protein
MRKLVERLMARQVRLMSELAEVQTVSTPVARSPVTNGSRAVERAALAQAEELLASGRVRDAREVLLPHSATASFARTLTLLARMNVIDGNADLALEQLYRAESLDPLDQATWRLLAEQLMRVGRYEEELKYRRKLALAVPGASSKAHVELVECLVRASSKWRSGAPKELGAAVDRLERLKGLTVRQRAQVAEALYGSGALKSRATTMYAEAYPCPASHADVEASWISMADWCDQRGIPLTRATDLGRVGRRPMVAEIPNAIVSPALGWTPVVDGGRAILAGFEKSTIPLRRETSASPMLMRAAASVALRLPKQIDARGERALLVGGHSDGMRNAVDFMGALAVAEHFDIGGDLPVLTARQLPPLQRALLGELGLDSRRLIALAEEDVVCFDRLVVPSRLSSGRSWVDPMLPAWFRHRFVRGRGAVAHSCKLVVFGASQDEPIDIEHVDDLSRVMHDATRLDLRTLSVSDLISAYGSASHVVAPIGEALAYMVFCAPGATIVALDHSGSPERRNRAMVLARACGHWLSVLRCHRPSGAGAPEFYIPTEALTAAMART